MSVIKVKGLSEQFTIVPNKMINDNLSWEARGMLLYLCSKPEDWEVCITDLVNQTKGSRKQSKRDSVRAIMKELISKGYMRKTQSRINGKFDNVDHEVSFEPIEPKTDFPSTANPTQQSKDLNKGKITEYTDRGSRIGSYFSNQLDQSIYRKPIELVGVLSKLKEYGYNAYDGSMTMTEWDECRERLDFVDLLEEDFEFWLTNHDVLGRFNKPASLYNLLCLGKKGKSDEKFKMMIDKALDYDRSTDEE